MSAGLKMRWLGRGLLVAAMTLSAALLVAPPAAAQTAPQTVSCSASGLLSFATGPRCVTEPVVCASTCTLTGLVTAGAPLRLGPVGGQLDARSGTSTASIASCVANASSCSASSPAGGILVNAGSYQGACSWKRTTLLAVHAKINCTLTATPTPCYGRPGCPWQNGDLTTYNQTNWGGDPGAAPAAMMLLSQFSTVYPAREVEVGIPGPSGYSMLFTSASAVIAYLPAVGAADALNADLLNPLSSSSGIFGAEVLAFRLNVDFSDAGITAGSAGVSFGDLTMCNLQLPHLTQFNGMSVREFLAAAETALGGGSSLQDLRILEPISDDLSNAFESGTPSTFAHDHVVNGACP